jgi:hypothetical protein
MYYEVVLIYKSNKTIFVACLYDDCISASYLQIIEKLLITPILFRKRLPNVQLTNLTRNELEIKWNNEI